MLSRFANVLYNAVDALAPPVPLLEDFIWHWNSVTKFYSSKNASNKVPIELTRIPGHLLEMLSILEQEEKELEAGSVGTCMEYMMAEKLLYTMYAFGTSDSPPGMKRYMLIFATRLLKTVKQFLLPHVSIYIPITKFIKLCGEIPAAPTEVEEIDFIEAVCDRLTENPHLVNCFMGYSSENERPIQSNGSLQNGSAFKDNHKLKISDSKSPDLFSSLLVLFSSPDNAISARASECIKTCCSLTNDAAAIQVVQNSNLSQALCTSIASFYAQIPKNTKLRDIEDPIVEFTEDGEPINNQKMSSTRRKFLCYLKNLHFFDTIVQQAHPVISDTLTSNFKSMFLDTVVYSDLVTSENAGENLFSTAVISTSIRHLSSSKLIAVFGFFLLGNMDDFEISGHSSHILKDLLITRCRDNDINLSLSISTLQLFEELLQRPSQYVLNNLVINYLEGRDYYDHTASDDWFSFSDDDTTGSLETVDNSLQSVSPPNRTFAPPYIHRIIDAFLSLLPDEIKSAENEEDSGYDTYIKEARCKFLKCLMHCEDFDWPQEPLTREDFHIGNDDSSSESQPEADSCWKFYEGPFVNMILDKIENMLELPYDISLQVTSLVARLALFTHPNLHEYILNPLIPYGLEVRSLFSVLLIVVEKIQVAVKDIQSFKQKLRHTRQLLLGETSSESVPYPETNALEVLIVVEEFCKELAAIAFVKYNAAS